MSGVSASVESVKIKPNCEGSGGEEGGREGGGGRGEEGIWLKALAHQEKHL